MTCRGYSNPFIRLGRTEWPRPGDRAFDSGCAWRRNCCRKQSRRWRHFPVRPSPGHSCWRCSVMVPTPEKPIVHVVDDDDSLRKALSRLLTSAGYEVHAYASAGDFALATREKRRGCLVLDLQMPGPSGLDLQ